jgi:hypothetical protein
VTFDQPEAAALAPEGGAGDPPVGDREGVRRHRLGAARETPANRRK